MPNAARLMMQAEKIVADLRDAQEAIAGESSAVAGLGGVMRRLERRRAQAPTLIDPVVKAIDATLVALDGAQAALETALRETAFEPGELERVEERLFALRAAARKHGTSVDQLPALAEKFAADLASIEAGEARLSELKAAADSASEAYHAACATLSKARAASAARLDKAVAKELPPLKLQGAKFSTDLARDESADSTDGYDRVEFRVQTNPGARPGPLMKVASGGELARFMLALKVVVADRGSAPTLVFDEIDTGIGGSVADAIGQRLAQQLAACLAQITYCSRLSAVSLDLTSLSAVRAAAAEVAALTPEVHVLMNNAGVMFTPFGRTSDGFEIQFGTNHLGHFALTRLLLPQLSAAGGSRVVNLSSDGHLMSDVDLNDPNWQHREYDKFLAYGASKTANVLHAVELDRRYRDRGIHSYAVHPGIVATALARHMSRDDFTSLQSVATTGGHRRENVDVRRDFVGPERGAATQVWAAVSPELADTGGVYLADCADPHRRRALRGRPRTCRPAVVAIRGTLRPHAVRMVAPAVPGAP